MSDETERISADDAAYLKKTQDDAKKAMDPWQAITNHVVGYLTEKYALKPGDTVDPATGVITRKTDPA